MNDFIGFKNISRTSTVKKLFILVVAYTLLNNLPFLFETLGLSNFTPHQFGFFFSFIKIYLPFFVKILIFKLICNMFLLWRRRAGKSAL